MTENEARRWIVDRFGVELASHLDAFVALIKDEVPRQNLISAISLNSIWTRHIVDSAQLLDLQSGSDLWIDVGTGAGFPGVVVAILSTRSVLLVEPRRRRVEFLRHVIDCLALGDRVEVRQSRIEAVTDKASVLSARAVASIETLLAAASRCTDTDTRWLLPKGRNALEEVARAKRTWHGTFHVEHSITDPQSMIVVADGVAVR